MEFLKKFISHIKRSGKEGQHTAEYIVLMVLVMAGILTMGPYVIRSWNATMKGFEDSATDSMEDPLITAAPPAIPSCTASSPIQVGCGASRTNICTGNPVSCAPTEMTSTQIFTPPGCLCSAPSVSCTPDDCCCTLPLVQIGCGVAMVSPPGSSPPLPCAGTGLIATEADGTCQDGYMGYSTTCGSGPTRYGCLLDPSCSFSCQVAAVNIPPASTATLCLNDDTGLTSNVNVTVVDSCTSTKCEYDCIDPCVPQSGAGGMYCGICPANQIYLGGCPAGQYDRRGCPAGQQALDCFVTPVDGVCNPSVKDACISGISANSVTTSSEFQWTCLGYAGSTVNDNCSIGCSATGFGCSVTSDCCNVSGFQECASSVCCDSIGFCDDGSSGGSGQICCVGALNTCPIGETCSIL